MKTFRQFVAENRIEPVKPVVPIPKELPQRKKSPHKPKKPDLPIREPDRYEPSKTPDFKPYKK